MNLYFLFNFLKTPPKPFFAGCRGDYSLAGVTVSSLHCADELCQEERNSCPLWRSCFIDSCHVGVSKRFSRSIQGFRQLCKVADMLVKAPDVT